MGRCYVWIVAFDEAIVPSGAAPRRHLHAGHGLCVGECLLDVAIVADADSRGTGCQAGPLWIAGSEEVDQLMDSRIVIDWVSGARPGLVGIVE